MIYDTGYHYRYSFMWKGYTYKLQVSNPGGEFVLLKFQGPMHDQYTPILESIIGVSKILKFLIMENIPLKYYLEVEKIFMEKVS